MTDSIPSIHWELLVKRLPIAWAEALVSLKGYGQTTPAFWLALLSQGCHADKILNSYRAKHICQIAER